MKAEKLKPPLVRANWPRCVHNVRLADGQTTTRRIREARARARGLPADVCGSYATHLLDGAPYCANHAGQMALRHLIAAK